MSAWLFLLHTHDERILHALVVRRRRTADLIMNGVTHLGDASFTIGLSLSLLAGLVPWLRTAGFTAAIAMAGSHLGVQLLKRSINRERPRLPVGCDSLIRAPDRFSFPSGHATASLSVAIPIADALPPIAGSAVLCAGAVVGVSRCYLGVHYPGDVVAGWILAIAGVALASFML